MSEIYRLLVKHFMGETSALEAGKVEDFKAKHPEQYTSLENEWYNQMSKIKDVDSQLAWETLKTKLPTVKRPSTYRRLKLIASIAAVFLLLLGSFFCYQSSIAETKLVVNNHTELPMEVNMPDGSIIYLRQEASISYLNNFEQNQRIVTLEGEALFEVAKDSSRSFIIKTAHAEVSGLGTSFNVEDSGSSTQVNVTTGRVKVKSLLHKDSVELNPGEAAISSKDSLLKFSTTNQNYASWRTGVFELNDMPLSEALDLLNDYYQQRIILKRKDANCHPSTTLSKKSLSEVAGILAGTCNLRVRERNGIYELY